MSSADVGHLLHQGVDLVDDAGAGGGGPGGDDGGGVACRLHRVGGVGGDRVGGVGADLGGVAQALAVVAVGVLSDGVEEIGSDLGGELLGGVAVGDPGEATGPAKVVDVKHSPFRYAWACSGVVPVIWAALSAVVSQGRGAVAWSSRASEPLMPSGISWLGQIMGPRR